MIGTLILTHGRLARELLEAAETIAGKLVNFEALTLAWDEPVEAARAKVDAALRRLDGGGGVLILTDMFGGTPHNVAVSFLGARRVEIVTGVNLPMVVRLGCQGEASLPLAELAEWIQRRGQATICRVAAGRPPEPEGRRDSAASRRARVR